MKPTGLHRLARMGVAVLVMAACGRVTTPGGPAATSPSATSPDELTTAQDRAKLLDLRNAMAAAKVFFIESGSYTGFDSGCSTNQNSCSNAEDIEPGLDWRSVARKGEGIVAVTLANFEDAVLTGISLSGEEFCIADSAGGGGGMVRGLGAGAATVATFAACEALGPDAW